MGQSQLTSAADAFAAIALAAIAATRRDRD